MQLKDADELRDRRQREGKINCTHKHIVKEYYLGSQTGDYVCQNCGESMSKSEWQKLGKLQ